METEEQFYVSDRTQLARWLPWLQLLRVFRVALGPRKVLLGAAAAFALAAGQRAIDEAPFAPADVRDADTARVDLPWDEARPRFEDGLEQPGSALWRAAAQSVDLLRPFRSVVGPGRMLLQLGNSWSDVAYAWTQLLWALTVWGLFGTALARMAVLDFAGRPGAGLRDSLKFSLRHIRSTVAAPLIPVAFLGVFLLICCIGGLAGRIPYVGEVLVGLLWFVPLLLGLAAAVIILCIAAGWPLMVCTVSVERSDAFDGLSRSYDYLVSRPWYAVWLAALSLALGGAAMLVVSVVVQLASHFAVWAVGSGMGDAAAIEITSAGPESLTSILATSELGPDVAPTGRVLAAVWLQGLALLEWGFVYSFFWGAMTMIYLLLRKSVDATSLDAVSLPDETVGNALPLSGVAAAEQREKESAGEESGRDEPQADST